MPDVEKVIEGLEMSYKYSNVDENNTLVPQWIVLHALALLKAQEPRLVTEADFENADAYGYLPVWVEDKDDSEIICDCITKHAITESDEDYHHRYWTSRPTDEQRKATPWELKPCPICGAKAFISHSKVDGFDFGWSVGCPRFCLADGIHGFDYDTPEIEVERHKPIGHYYTTKERAVEAWNDRVEAGEWRIGPWQRMT